MQPRLVAVLPDIHAPYHDASAIAAVCDYLKDDTWAELIILGDLLDAFCVSRWNKGKPGSIAGKTIKDEAEAAGEVLDQLLEAVRLNNPACKAVLLEGNHEHRLNDYCEENPQLEGLLEVPRLLHLRKRRVRWIQSWSKGDIYRVNNAQFTHGYYCNKHHAFKHADVYGGCTYYGHLHDVMEFGKPCLGHGRQVMAKSIGCLCDLEQPYTKGRPHNWQQAFSVFWFHGGKHQECTVKLQDGAFIGPTTGTLYSAKTA